MVIPHVSLTPSTAAQVIVRSKDVVMGDQPNVKRWTAKRKTAVVMGIMKGKTMATEVTRQHDFSG